MTTPIPQKTLIALHVAPGLVLLLVFIILSPVFMRLGLPPGLAAIAGVLLFVIPGEWLFLFWQGKRLNGHYILTGLLANQPIPAWQYFVYVPLFLFWSILAASVIALWVESPLHDEFLARTPAWMNPYSFDNASRDGLWLLFGARLLVLGILAPLTEELYFRGYLLPRLSWMKGWGPLVHAALFSCQHFLEPYGFFSRLVAFLPVAYLVQKKQNVFISILWHCLLNSLSALTMLPALPG